VFEFLHRLCRWLLIAQSHRQNVPPSYQTNIIHVEVYTMDRKEAGQFEKEIVEIYEKDLNLIFVVVRPHPLLPQLI